jgi:hypothetical protein
MKKQRPKTATEKRFKRKFGFWPTKTELAMNMVAGTIKINLKTKV